MSASPIITRGYLFAAKYVVTAGYNAGAEAATKIRDLLCAFGILPFRR